MAVSLSKRLEGREKEFVAYENTYGDGETMRHFGILDFISFKKYKERLEKEGYHFSTHSPHVDELGEQIVAAMRNSVLKDQAEMARLKSEIANLQRELQYYKIQKRAQESHVIEEFFETLNAEDGGRFVPELHEDSLEVPAMEKAL